MIVKVCGMTAADNISEVAAAGADMIGMVFWPRSPRYVAQVPSHTGLLPDAATLPAAAGGPRRVGVFVDDSVQDIITRVVNFGLDCVQLHGDEPPTMLRNLRRSIAPDIRPGIKLIKAIGIGGAEDFGKCAEYEDCADLLLFDTRCPGAGGSGRQFDWTLLDSYRGSLPFLLSGGIGPGDEERLAALRHPLLAGIDLNSRFETAPGVKDAAAVGRFISRYRRCLAAESPAQSSLLSHPSQNSQPSH